MRASGLIVLFIILSVTCVAQQKDDGRPFIPHLNGNVKYLEEATDSDSFKIANPGDLLPYLQRYTFDQKARCTSHIMYYRKAAPRTIQFAYNDQDRSDTITTLNELYPDKISSQTISHYRTDGSLLSQEVRFPGASVCSLKCDEKGNPVEVNDTFISVRRKTSSKDREQPSISGQIWKNSYNNLGQLSERSVFIHDSLVSRAYFKYDAHGNEILHETISSAGKLLSQTNATYDDRNRRIEHRYLAPKEISHSRTIYNKYNDPIRVTYFKPSGKVLSQYKSKYRYDQMHNWIERRTSFRKESYRVIKDSVDEMLDQKSAVMTGYYVTKRTIQYY